MLSLVFVILLGKHSLVFSLYLKLSYFYFAHVISIQSRGRHLVSLVDIHTQASRFESNMLESQVPFSFRLQQWNGYGKSGDEHVSPHYLQDASPLTQSTLSRIRGLRTLV